MINEFIDMTMPMLFFTGLLILSLSLFSQPKIQEISWGISLISSSIFAFSTILFDLNINFWLSMVSGFAIAYITTYSIYGINRVFKRKNFVIEDNNLLHTQAQPII